MQINLSSLSDTQKKLIGWAIAFGAVGGGGFWGGIKFTDVKIKAEVGKYQIQIDKLAKNVADKDIQIASALQQRDDKMQEALNAKKAAEVIGVKADKAVAAFRTLEAKLYNVQAAASDIGTHTDEVPPSAIGTHTDEVPPSAIDIAVAADDVIAKKDEQIQGINIALNNCFDAKAAADKAIQELQSNETDLKEQVTLKDRIGIDLSKEVESQKRRKWLYLLGGVITGFAVDHTIKK